MNDLSGFLSIHIDEKFRALSNNDNLGGTTELKGTIAHKGIVRGDPLPIVPDDELKDEVIP